MLELQKENKWQGASRCIDVAKTVHEVPHHHAACVLQQGSTQAKDRHDKGQLAQDNPQNMGYSCAPQTWICISVSGIVCRK